MTSTETSAWTKIRVEWLDGRQFVRLRLAAGKGNVIDSRVVQELRAAVEVAADTPGLRAILLDHEGDHFSYGASVEEHKPDTVEGLLRDLHAFAREVLDCGVAVIASVRGVCLGGGLELALLADRIIAGPTARFGQPEVQLGVFAPIGSLLLPRFVSRKDAADLLLSGRSIDGSEALEMGLVAEIAEDPTRAAVVWAREHLAPKSASSLRFAVRASRLWWSDPFLAELRQLEGVYLEELMATSDAAEGIYAFVGEAGPALGGPLMGLESIVERCEGLYEDLDLAAVRAWKDSHPDGRAVGYLPTYVPRELMHAAGVLPVGILGAGDQLEIVKGDAYFQSYICHLPRSVIELGLSGRLDALDGMIFPSTCDVIRNLSGIWKLRFPTQYVKYLDVPQNFALDVGGTFYRSVLEELLDDMSRLTGRKTTDDDLRSSIRIYNENRRKVIELYETRAAEPWSVRGSELYLLLRAAMVLPVEEHTELLEQYAAEVCRADRSMLDNARVVLTGGFCEQPPLTLIRTLERAGCDVVDDDFMLVTRWLGSEVSEEGDPLDALVEAYLGYDGETASRYVPDGGRKGERLVETVRRTRAEGVVFAAPSFCDPALLERPMLQEALSEAGISFTAFKYAENTGQMQPIREQAGTFADTIKLWGGMKAAIVKEPSMLRQKELIEGHFRKLAEAKEAGKKVVYTFVPGNLTELMLAFDTLPVHPEINALQSGLRKRSGEFIAEAERAGHSEDVCTYVKCDIGMMLKGNIGPTGEKIPEPDLLLLSYTGCFTFLKWFELLRERYKCPVAMLHVPYQADGEITPEMLRYVVDQLEREVIPKFEKVTGTSLDHDRLAELLGNSRVAEDDLVWALESAKNRPSPIDAYFGGVYYIGPMFTAFRGTPEAVDYYRILRAEIEQRIAAGHGPVTPEGVLDEERFRLVVEGPPNWTHFREFWKMFYDERAVVVASTYTKVGGVYDRGFRHDPDHPLETLAEYCLGCYTNLDLPTRVDMISRYIEDYEADGFLINSIKSCNSFSAGQLVMLREIEERTGRSGGFIETDLVDPRYFSPSNVKNRLESYFQMLAQKTGGGVVTA